MFNLLNPRFARIAALLVAGALALANGMEASSGPTTVVASEAADRDLFGAAVDVSGDLIAVGAYSTDLERDDMGVVYLFDRSGDGVRQAATLAASDGELGDSFGASVAISDDALLVGAPGVILSELNEGAAYLFERDGDSWIEVTRVHRESPSRNDMFGSAVALDDEVAVVGAPGADAVGEDSGTALVFERRDGEWQQVAALVPDGEPAGERFGSAVAVDEGRILVGASGNVHAGEDTGSAYLFERTNDGWASERLVPSDGKGGDGFGDSVALAGDLALIGARFADLTGSDEGSAYVFERRGDGWEEVAKLTAPNPSDRDQFGHSVALAGQVALVGAPRVDEPARDAGGVWAFAGGMEGWARSDRLMAAAPEMYDEFGSTLAAGDSVVVVGTPQDIPEASTEEAITGTVTIFWNLP